MSPGKRTRRLEPRRYRPSANYGQLERYNRTLMQAVRCYVERPRTNGTSTSGRSRVRYAPCPVNSSTGYTQPVDAGKGDLLYPVPDPTPRPGGGGGGYSHIMSHRYVPLWRLPFSVFSSRSHDMRFYQTAPRFASDSLPRYTKNNAPMRTAPHSPLPGTARSLASVILPLRHSLFSLAAS